LSAPPETFSQIEFLGCLVESFSCSFGFNSSPSTLDVVLVEEITPVGQPDKLFLADDFDFSDLDGQIKAATGGAEFQDGNPGGIVEFKTPDNKFNFVGIITSYKRTNSTSGRKIQVRLSDLRILLKHTPLLTRTDFSHLDAAAPYGGYVGADRNVINAFQLNGGSAVSVNWTEEGMRSRDVLSAVLLKTLTFFNKTVTIAAPEQPAYKSVLNNVLIQSRTPQQFTTVSAFLDGLGASSNFDWYIDTVLSGDDVVILLYAIARNNNTDIFTTENSVSQFITNNKDNLVSFNSGREYRDGPSETLMFGDNYRITHPAFNGDSDIFVRPYFCESSSGEIYDSVFVDLSSISSSDVGLLNNLPSIFVQSRRFNTGTDIAGNDVQRSKSTGLINKTGYFTTIEVLRAALHSKESWETAVYYQHTNLNTTETGRLNVSQRPFFDVGNQLGGSSGELSTVQSAIAQKLGVYKPSYNRQTGNPFITNLSTSIEVNEFREALKDACFEATRKAAEKYYGKAFIVRLPYDKNYDDDLASIGGSNGAYTIGGREILPEYDIVESAPALQFTNSVVEDSSIVPEFMQTSDSRSFVSSKGMFKPIFAVNTAALSNSSSVSYEGFSYEGSRRHSGGDAETNGSLSFFTTSELSIKRHQFDPRFALVSLNGHINLGYGKIRNIVTTKAQVGENAGQVTNVTDLPDFATEPSNKDQSGGTQEFFSWLYRNFTIVPNLGTSVDESSLRIDAAYYESLINIEAKKDSPKVGFAQKRFTGIQRDIPTQNVHERDVSIGVQQVGSGDIPKLISTTQIGGIQVNCPLKLNYRYYGPWFFNDVDAAVGKPTQFMQDKNLNPWNYGSFPNMIEAGKLLVANATAIQNTLMTANVSLQGLPLFNLGSQPNDATETSAVANLSAMQVSYGAQGVVTSYTFKTYFGPVGFIKRDEIDTINDSTVGNNVNKKDLINFDDILRKIGQEGNNDKNFLGGNPFGPPLPNPTPTPTVAVIAGTSGKPRTQPTASAMTERQMVESVQSRPDRLIETNATDGLHYAALNEIFIPITTTHPDLSTGFAPSMQGIKLEED